MKLSAPIHQLKRHAKALARNRKIPLHAALDRIAEQEGFATWSLLASRQASVSPARAMLSELSAGTLFLIGARPGQGKTRLGLRLLLAAIAQGRRAIFFTLHYTGAEATGIVRSLAPGDLTAQQVEILTSDDIGADFIIDSLSDAPPGTIAIVDYLQLLDQKRSNPVLSIQLASLRDFAQRKGIVLGFLSQISRTFDPNRKPLPDHGDIHLPNPADMGVFSRFCFLHSDRLRLQHAH